MEIRSGYKTITPIQFANVLWALEQGVIDNPCLRVYFACFVLVAVREAAKRSSAQRGKRPKQLPRYRLNEIERLTQMPLRAVKRSLAGLGRVGLVQYAEAEIFITEAPMCGSNELLEILSCGRSPRRPIPVPRAILRFLAQSTKVALAKTIIAYLLRGLSLARRGGAIFHKGTVKISWIATTFGLSERAVRYARACLVQMGWIERDTHSYQRKLNRDGAYFVINLNWSLPKTVFENPIPGGTGDPPVVSGDSPHGTATTSRVNEERPIPVVGTVPALVKREKSASDFAPPMVGNCTDFAPPYKDKKTSYEVNQNRKTQPVEPSVAGFCKKGRGGNQLPTPTLNRIQREHLHRFSCLEILYFEAIVRGWIDASEATALNFISAAVRAREIGDDPPRLFVTLVRRGLWHHITQAQEDHARRALIRFRVENPDRFRCTKLETPPHPRQLAA